MRASAAGARRLRVYAAWRLEGLTRQRGSAGLHLAGPGTPRAAAELDLRTSSTHTGEGERGTCAAAPVWGFAARLEDPRQQAAAVAQQGRRSRPQVVGDVGVRRGRECRGWRQALEA